MELYIDKHTQYANYYIITYSIHTEYSKLWQSAHLYVRRMKK